MLTRFWCCKQVLEQKNYKNELIILILLTSEIKIMIGDFNYGF